MARPQKVGMEYFPLDCRMDDKVEILEAEHGLLGFAVYIKLLQEIYQTEDGKLDMSVVFRWKTLGKRLGIDAELLENIVELCLEVGLFCKTTYQNEKNLTSNGIQKRIGKVADMRNKDRSRKKEPVSEFSKSFPSENDIKGKGKGNNLKEENNAQREGVKEKLLADAEVQRTVKRAGPDLDVEVVVEQFLRDRKINSDLLHPFAEYQECYRHFFNWIRKNPGSILSPKTHAVFVPPNYWDRPLLDACDRWLAYKKDRGQFYNDAAVETLIRQIEKARTKHGEAAVIDRIDDSIVGSMPNLALSKIRTDAPGKFSKPPPVFQQPKTADFSAMR